MQCFILFLLLAIVVVQNQTIDEEEKRLICYYDGSSFQRAGLAKLTLTELEPSLPFCSHLIYGYAGIDPVTNSLISNNQQLDLDEASGLYRKITSLKSKFPKLKILLSIGGDRDSIEPENNKYLKLLETSTGRVNFKNSAYAMVKTYGFDGLDLAWQFPKYNQRNRRNPFSTIYNNLKRQNSLQSTTMEPNPKQDTSISENTAIGTDNGYANFWNSFKNIFPAERKVEKRAVYQSESMFYIDENADEHKTKFTAVVRHLETLFRPDGYVLSLSVLPNVNSSVYFDVPTLVQSIDFVNLHTYDFQTPEYNEIADYPAPTYELNERNPEANVNYQVEYWLNNQCPGTMINIGIAAYGRSWKVRADTDRNSLPPVLAVDGAGAAGIQTNKPGLLSWPEVCSMLPNPANIHSKGADAPLRKISDPTKRFGTYAYRPIDTNGDHGIWVGYEDPDTAANKAGYVRAKGLGGVALVDLSFDDFRGSCSGDKYPILRAIKYRL